MQYTEILPDRALRRFVDAFWTLSSLGESSPPEAGTILPDGMMEIVVSCGGGISVPPDRRLHRRLVLGPSDRARRVRYAGPVELVGVRLRPGVARSLLAIRIAPLGDRIVPLGAVARALDRRISRVIFPGRPSTNALHALQLIVTEVSYGASAPDPILARAVAEIRSRRGRVNIDALAARLGVSRRTLERRFLREVGLTPKRWCRVARFQSAVLAMPAQCGRGWADFAQHLGYADQAHFSREFSEFSGAPPTAVWWTSR